MRDAARCRASRRAPPRSSGRSWPRRRPTPTPRRAPRALLRCTVKDTAARPGGPGVHRARRSSSRSASYPGFTMTAPPGRADAVRHLPRRSTSTASAVAHTVVHADGRREVVADPPSSTEPADHRPAAARPSPYPAPTDALTRRMPLGTFVHARSGDKGGDANLGALGRPRRLATTYDARVEWLSKLITPAEGARAGARGGRPRRRGVPAAQPRRASTS